MGNSYEISMFLDQEKEPIGFGQNTLFVFNKKDDSIGNIAGKKEEDPEFTFEEYEKAVSFFNVERIYLNARETEFPIPVLNKMVQVALEAYKSITIETESSKVARFFSNRSPPRVEIVLRNDVDPERVTIKVRNGEELKFAFAQKLWSHNTEVGPTELKRLLGSKLDPKVPNEEMRAAWWDKQYEEEDIWNFTNLPHQLERVAALDEALAQFELKGTDQGLWDMSVHEGFVLSRLENLPNIGCVSASDISPKALARAKGVGRLRAEHLFTYDLRRLFDMGAHGGVENHFKKAPAKVALLCESAYYLVNDVFEWLQKSAIFNLNLAQMADYLVYQDSRTDESGKEWEAAKEQFEVMGADVRYKNNGIYILDLRRLRKK